MNSLEVGAEYRVDAPNTSSRETWVVTEIKDNGEVVAKGDKTAYPRTFRAEQFTPTVKEKKKMAKSIKSESVTHVADLQLSGVSMHVERIDYMPHHERRGRKPNE